MFKFLKKKDDSEKVNSKSLTKNSFFSSIKNKNQKKDIAPKESVENELYTLSTDFDHLSSVTKKNLFIEELQTKLDNVTKLHNNFVNDFEKLYKGAYFISNNKYYPRWLQNYDLLFIGNSHAIIFSKFNTGVGPLLRIENIMNTELKIKFLNNIFFKIEFLINHLIKMYNEGKNRNYHFRDSINDLKYLGLISEKLYDRLLFIASVRSRVSRSWNINEIKFPGANNQLEKLHTKHDEFKALLSEVYFELIQVYMRVQRPYLRKFSLLWSNRKLILDDPVSFYHI